MFALLDKAQLVKPPGVLPLLTSDQFSVSLLQPLGDIMLLLAVTFTHRFEPNPTALEPMKGQLISGPLCFTACGHSQHGYRSNITIQMLHSPHSLVF